MGMTISILRMYSRRSVLSYQRRFPVVYFTYPAMRRPRFVNKQHEVCAFCVYIPMENKTNNNINSKTQTIMRKLFFLFLALVATASLWAHDFEVDGIYYYFNSSTLTAAVTYRGSSYNTYTDEYTGSITIPETIIYEGITYRVTDIGESAFDGCSSLTSVIIPNSITSIGSVAFYGCTSLTSITLPNSITNIGGAAFANCYSLTSITIPTSVTNIERNTFAGCSSLSSIIIPNNITSIGYSAFYGCSSLTSVTINSDAILSKNYSWDANISHIFGSQVTNYFIGNDVTSIGKEAFRGCDSLTSITIPNSVTSIGYSAFYGCSSLTSMTIPCSITDIGGEIFGECYSLTSVTINSNAVLNYNRSMYEILGLRNTKYNEYSIIIGDSVTSIGGEAFSRCTSLSSITIPNSVTSIGNYAFNGCSGLTSITIPNSVTSIGNYAFNGCSGLTSITIPNSVTSIGNYAFYDCSSLTSITIPNSITKIERESFYNCSSLTSITIPNSVISIGDNAFFGCSSLGLVHISDLAAWCGITFEDYDSNPLFYAKNLYLNENLVTDLVIPNDVTSIGNYNFIACSGLTSITIPNSVISIGSLAFNGCSGLISITIPKSVTNIGADAFYGCSGLTSITCEAETPPTIIGDRAFDLVPTSIPVYVPCGCVGVYGAASGWNSFTNIQEPVAEYSINVTTSGGGEVDVYNSICGNSISAHPSHGYHFVQWSDGNTDNPRTLKLTQDTTLMAMFAPSFSGKCGDNLYWSYNENEQSITITGTGYMYDYYTSGTQPWALFMGNIKKVTTDNTAKSFGAFAFDGAIRLAEVHIGTSIETIDIYAFGQCDRLRNIYCYPTYPPIISDYSFVRYDANLYLPCDYIEDYMFDYYWKKFENVQCAGAEKEEMGSNGVEVAPSSTSVTITWPTEGNADTYTIVIKKGNEVFCTLTFNADGQLLNIAFAPGRDGNHPIQYAEQAGNGYRFTVTSLESGTKYGYNIDVKDAANKTIKSHSGEFTTQSTTAVDNITTNNANIQKIMRDGQFIIVRDGVEYNAMGQEIGN